MGVSDPTMALGRATLGQSSTPVYLPGPVDIRGVDRCKRLSLKSISPTRDLTFMVRQHLKGPNNEKTCEKRKTNNKRKAVKVEIVISNT